LLFFVTNENNARKFVIFSLQRVDVLAEKSLFHRVYRGLRLSAAAAGAAQVSGSSFVPTQPFPLLVATLALGSNMCFVY